MCAVEFERVMIVFSRSARCVAPMAWGARTRGWGRHRAADGVERSRPPAAGRMRQRPLEERRPTGRCPRAVHFYVSVSPR